MTVHRFFVEPDAVRGERFPVPASIERQVRTVLRLRAGDRLVLLSGDGGEIECELDGSDCVVVERRATATEPRHRLTVVQALLKGDALEDVVQHATEVGASAFRLVVTDRCVARDVTPRRLERLRAIARESAEQSERGIVPSVHEPGLLADALQPGAVLLAERHDAVRLRDVEPPSAIIIGPEGGWTPAELQAARDAGVMLAGLGPRILRSQTVAAVAVAVVLSRTGDFA